MLKERDEDINAMLILLTLTMTISSSTCKCERGFSGINQQQTKEKVSMNHVTLNDIMLITVDGPVTSKVDAKRGVDSWLGRGKRRLETGHKNTRREKKKTC